MRPLLRRLSTISVFALAGYGALHLLDTVYLASFAAHESSRVPFVAADLLPKQQPLVSALTRVLVEDGVGEAERWATAIVKTAPTDDVGYLALVTAQIRRESGFLARDLEWLYSRVVPQLVHELGVNDPIRTVGPMQVQRWRLATFFERALGREVTAAELKQLAYDVEAGVAACVAVLDRIVVEHFPDRRIRGHRDFAGPAGFSVYPAITLARDFRGHLEPLRGRIALHQKLLSDLTARPLAIDGIAGEDTLRAFDEHSQYSTLELASAAWTARFGVAPPAELAPRITHDPRLAFVFADFNAGTGASRVAALQALLIELTGIELACDGKLGPETRLAMRALFERCEPDEERRREFVQLVNAGHKPEWVADRAFELARKTWALENDYEAPTALVPDLWFDGFTQSVKGLGRISVEGYVAGSEAFFEDYLRRLALCLGLDAPPARRASKSVRN